MMKNIPKTTLKKKNPKIRIGITSTEGDQFIKIIIFKVIALQR